MNQMFRRREGTGAMYADNRRRAPRSLVRHKRRSGMFRGPNRDRPWAQESDDPEPLDHVDLAQLIVAARQVASTLLGLLEDVGGYMQKCRRTRQSMAPEVMADMGDLLDWYLVLYTIGLIDRQGRWLAGDLLGREVFPPSTGR
ncbi:MAG: hypothetical protein ACOYOB_08895 [Myxococcota bacterium]